MSLYTTELRYICEVEAGLSESKGYNDVADIIAQSRTKIFSFNYPIFDDEYKSVLETKIIRHFYTREISEETYGLWKLRLESRMNEIMPYYNKLYESELKEFDPFNEVDYTRNGERNGTGDNHGTSSGSGNGSSSNANSSNGESTQRDSFSDTPQGSLAGVEDNTYLTTYDKVVVNDSNASTANASFNNTTNSETDSHATSTEEYFENIRGKISYTSYSKLLKEWRDTFLNIDMKIIRDLEDLFFMLWM